jgi:hypothetical protein
VFTVYYANGELNKLKIEILSIFQLHHSNLKGFHKINSKLSWRRMLFLHLVHIHV